MPAASGWYKGIRFRSLLELSFVLSAEEAGLVPGVDLLYEVDRVPYGRSGRTYIIDFRVVPENVIVEVKPSSRTATTTFKSKSKAAREFADRNGLRFAVVTERDLDRVLTLKEAAEVPGVVLGERARRRLRRMGKR